MISLGALVQAVVYLIVAGLIVWLLYWLLGEVNPPEPFRKIGRVLLAVVSVLVVISILMGLIGKPIVTW